LVLKGEDIQSTGLIESKSNDRIPQSISSQFPNTILAPEDIVVSVRGYVGKVGIVDSDVAGSQISPNLIRLSVDSRKVDPYYVWLFLNSRPGQLQFECFKTLTAQETITSLDIKRILIPILPRQLQADLRRNCLEAIELTKRSKSLYAEAEALLLAELGLDDLDLSHQPTYTRNFSEAWAAGRLDAEYFQPKYQWAMEIMGQSGKTIGDVVRLTKRRFEPKPGEPFQYIEIGDVGPAGHAESKTVPGEEAPSRAQWIVKAGDVITSTVRPIRRLTALIGPEQDGYVCSSGFAVLKPVAIEPEVLLVYLRLPVVCEILDLHTSASMYPAISTTDLLSVPIPIPPDEVRARVVELVRESRKSHREAKRLLEEAKRRVEEMVLGEEAS